jgi:hypothetical protein
VLPVDPDLLLFIKLFVVFTCVFFWIKLFYDSMRRSLGLRRYHHQRHRDEDGE